MANSRSLNVHSSVRVSVHCWNASTVDGDRAWRRRQADISQPQGCDSSNSDRKLCVLLFRAVVVPVCLHGWGLGLEVQK